MLSLDAQMGPGLKICASIDSIHSIGHSYRKHSRGQIFGHENDYAMLVKKLKKGGGGPCNNLEPLWQK